ncbi:MAG: DMT family transporter [Rhodospirillales bacterium]|nr:DMT family transporter [Rhodospirillales bacterium]
MRESSIATQQDSAIKGIACFLASGLISALQDSTIKWLAGSYPVGQVLALRGLCVLLTLGFFVWHAGGLGCLIVRQPGAQALRAVFFVASTGFFIWSLQVLPLADSIAITFTGPLFVTALAPWLLKETVNWRRWTAVLVGFAGVLVIMRPVGETIHLVALLPVASAFSGALRDIVTRRMTQGETSTAILFYSTLGAIAFGFATVPFGWQPLRLFDAGLLLASGFFSAFAQFLAIQAFRYAEAAVVIPFKYVTLVWAAIAGYLVFGDIPGPNVLAGAALVVGSGLYIFHRESKRRQIPKEKGGTAEAPPGGM